MLSVIYGACCGICFVLLITLCMNRDITKTKYAFSIYMFTSLLISIIPLLNTIIIISYIIYINKKSFN